VRDRASWRKGAVVKVEGHTRVVRFEDNGAELTFQVDQLEVRVTRNHFQKGALHASSCTFARLPPKFKASLSLVSPFFAYGCQIFAHDDKLALVFRDWFWSHTLRRIELPPPPPHGVV